MTSLERMVFSDTMTRHWDQILNKWCDLNIEYSRIMEQEDCAYFYTEMTHVSLLSTALWMCGYASVVEANSTKKLKIDRRKRSLGRTDLYYYGHNIAGTVEAKYRMIDIDAPIDKIDFNHGLDSALKDIRNNIVDEIDELSAICFYCLASERSKDMETLFKFASTAKQKTAAQFGAWLFPEFGANPYHGDNWHYPGVLVLGKQFRARP